MRHRSILKDPDRDGPSTSAIWKKVCWDDCHIREFPYVLGDNPAVSKGAPLQIDWDYHHEDVVDVDVFEHCRAPVRRHRKKIVLSARKRAKILLAAGHTVEEIADMTLECQNAKKARVESLKSFGNFGDQLFSGNLMDFMSGTAEVTGRTLKLVGLDSISNAGINLVLGTGKMATDVVVGTGKIGRDVVVGTGKVATDVVVGTGKVATDVVVGTGKLGRDVVLGTGTLMVKGTLGTGKTLMGAARRVTGIFVPGDLQRSDLRDGKAHLKHVSGVTDPAASASNLVALNTSDHSTRKHRSHDGGRSRRRLTEGSTQLRTSLSPQREPSSRQQRTDPASKARRKHTSPLREDNSLLAGVMMDQDKEALDELAEMEEFMLHLQGLSPDQVKAAMG